MVDVDLQKYSVNEHFFVSVLELMNVEYFIRLYYSVYSLKLMVSPYDL